MAVDASDLLQPLGPIDSSFFPGQDAETLNETLSAYIDDGTIRVGALPADVRDDAVTAWALWRAFDAIALRLITTPASATIEGEGSQSYNAMQSKLMRDRADAQLETFRGFAAAVSTSTGTQSASQTGSLNISFQP